MASPTETTTAVNQLALHPSQANGQPGRMQWYRESSRRNISAQSGMTDASVADTSDPSSHATGSIFIRAAKAVKKTLPTAPHIRLSSHEQALNMFQGHPQGPPAHQDNLESDFGRVYDPEDEFESDNVGL